LNDVELPRILEAAAEAGARGAGYTLLRLPWTVRPVFQEWLDRTQSESVRDKVSSLIQHTRGGKWNDPNFRSRFRGEGAIAEQIGKTFKVFAARYGLNAPQPQRDVAPFRRPVGKSGQLRLFE
jgi:DNA repair photolyase